MFQYGRHHPSYLMFFQHVNILGQGFIYIVGSLLGFLCCLLISRNRQLVAMFLFVFLVSALSGIVCDVLKIILARARPDEFLSGSQHLYGFQFLAFKASWWSFPSGHATVVISSVMAVWVFYRHWWCVVLGVILITLVCMSRIITHWHYPSDIMAGLYLGAITVILLRHYLRRFTLFCDVLKSKAIPKAF